METTRHFTATVYVVHEGATALHEHERLEMWLPPGGHVDRDELPHEAAKREAREELGLAVELVAETGDIASPHARSIPEPQHFLLEDINVHNGEVGHQHIDFVYYGRVESREITPGPGEASADAWEWFTAEELQASAEKLEPDVRQPALKALETVSSVTDRSGSG